MTKSPSPSPDYWYLFCRGIPLPLCVFWPQQYLGNKLHKHSKTSLTRASIELHLRCCRRPCRNLHCIQFSQILHLFFLEIQTWQMRGIISSCDLEFSAISPMVSLNQCTNIFLKEFSRDISCRKLTKLVKACKKKEICRKNKNNMNALPLVASPIGFWFFISEFSFLRYLVW